MDCNTCKEKREENTRVSYIEHRADMAMMERTNKRWFRAFIIVFLAFVISNGFWIWREKQFETVETTTTTQEVEQNTEGGGDNHFVGGDYNGASESTNNDNDNETPSP